MNYVMRVVDIFLTELINILAWLHWLDFVKQLLGDFEESYLFPHKSCFILFLIIECLKIIVQS